MKILVTGGAGFIGSNFIRYWLNKEKKDEVVNLDLLTYAGNKESLKDIEKDSRYTFIQGDIRDNNIIEPLVRDTDIIVHFAAESHVDRSILGPEAFIETNIKGTFVLLEAAKKHNKHFHHVSTDEVFGELELTDKKKFTETTPYNPSSPYSASKAASDHLVRAYAATYGLPITITNCSNNFGPYQYPEKFIPRLITDLLDGDTAKIYGDGLYVRDWLHVEDHCQAIAMIIKAKKKGETYLLGGMTDDVNNLQVAKLILKYLKLPESRIEFVSDRPGHDRRYAVEWSKINQNLGWQPRYSFADWLEKTVTWYQHNEWWWRPLKASANSIYPTSPKEQL